MVSQLFAVPLVVAPRKLEHDGTVKLAEFDQRHPKTKTLLTWRLLYLYHIITASETHINVNGIKMPIVLNNSIYYYY